MKKIAILGGTFDPIHVQHIKIAFSAYKNLNLDEIWILPTKHNPLKQNISATDEQRIFMIKQVISEFPWIKLKTYEIENSSLNSYTIDTIKYFKNKYHNIDFYFIIGADNLYSLEKWKDVDQLISLVKLVVVNRPHFRRTINLMEKYGAINLIVKPSNEVSSSSIRNGLNINQVDEKINDYINEELIYYKERLMNHLDEKRYIHCLNTGKMAAQLAVKHNVDVKKALIAGTYHDIAKQWSDEHFRQYLLKYYPQGLNSPRNLYHAYCGALYLKNHFNYKDQEIIEAIFKHTSGAQKMSKLDLIVLLADKISEERTYDYVAHLKDLAFNDLELAFSHYLDILKSSLIERNYEITDEFNLIYDKWKIER